MPLLIVVFGAFFLKETVRLYRWSAVFVGMIGVAIIVWPRLTVFAGRRTINGLTLGVLASLAVMRLRRLCDDARAEARRHRAVGDDRPLFLDHLLDRGAR